MIAKDLELLGLLRLVNTNIPNFVLRLTEDMPNGELPAEQLRELAGIFHGLGDQFLARAEEVAPTSSDERPRVVQGSTG